MAGFNDTLNNIKIQQSLAPASISASAAPSSMNKAGALSTVHIVSVGALTNPDDSDYFALYLYDSADDSTYAVVDDLTEVIFKINDTITTPETIASGIIYKLNAAGDASKEYSIEYVGIKQYSKIVITEVVSATDASALIGVVSFNTGLTNVGGSGALGVIGAS